MKARTPKTENQPSARFRKVVAGGPQLARPIVMVSLLLSLSHSAMATTIVVEEGSEIQVRLAAKEIRRYVYLRTGELLPIPAFEGKALNRETPLFWQWSRGGASREGDLKAVFWGNGGERKWKLHDFSTVLNETDDLAPEMPETFEALSEPPENEEPTTSNQATNERKNQPPKEML